jgi:CheY-like chemotaxis protein
VQALSPDVVLMDVEMPEMNGIETTIALRATASQSAVVILSINDDQFARTRAAAAGAVAFVEKRRANSLSLIFQLLLPFTSNAFVSPDSMPVGVRWFAQYQPFTPVIDTLRGLLLGPRSATARSSPLPGASSSLCSDTCGHARSTTVIPSSRQAKRIAVAPMKGTTLAHG